MKLTSFIIHWVHISLQVHQVKFKYIVSIYYTFHISFTGPACDNVCASAAFIAQHWGMPLVSYACAADQLMDRKQYTTFARTSTIYDDFVYVVEDLMIKYNWDRLVLVEGHEQIWTDTAEFFGVTISSLY